MLQDKKTIITPYYQTDSGQAYLGDSLKLMKLIPDNSVNLVLTSPPFALTRQKEYGNKLARSCTTPPATSTRPMVLMRSLPTPPGAVTSPWALEPV